MKLRAKNRMALVNKKNMKRLKGYFDREGCIGFDLSWAVNYLIDIALGELEAIDDEMNCSECEFLKSYNHTHKNYYCDHEDRIDDMGKLSVDRPPKTSPVWCPKRRKE